MGDRRAAGKRPLERPRCRLEDIIKMDLARSGMGWHGLA